MFWGPGKALCFLKLPINVLDYRKFLGYFY